MSNTTTTWHSIREASMISGLPESTLRYYEQIGIIDPIARDPFKPPSLFGQGHRIADHHRMPGGDGHAA